MALCTGVDLLKSRCPIAMVSARAEHVYIVHSASAQPFAYDPTGLTAQIPIGDGAATAGGRTVYALPSGELLVPERVAGRVLAHHGDVAHGVTQLTAGVRYGFYALVARADAERAL